MIKSAFKKYDEIDIALLSELQRFPSLEPTSITELADRLGLTPSPVHARVKRLRQNDVIRSWSAVLSPKNMGINLISFLNVTLKNHSRSALEQFENIFKEGKQFPYVTECYATTGPSVYILKVMCDSLESYASFVQYALLGILNVAHVTSMIVLKEVAYTTQLPLEQLRRT